MPYLIDGHNLIPKLGLRLDSPDDELELIRILQEFARRSRRELHVYFDGAPAGEAGSRKFGGVTAHFVRATSSADAAIRAQLAKLGRAARNWTLVSSDREVQASAAAMHATVLPAEQFANQLWNLQQRASGQNTERPMSEREIEEWLRTFGDKE